MVAAAIRWSDIQALYDADPAVHRARVRDIGLDAPADVFEQLFHEPHADPLFTSVVHLIDWSGVTWRVVELSGLALAEAQIPREYERAVEEARGRTAQEGLQDERASVVAHWGEEGTWFRAPVLVTGEVVDRLAAYELLVGFTRLGNLLGLMDREEVPSYTRHRVWIGSRFSGP